MPLNLLPVIADQLTITGSIMGTLEDMENMMNLIAQAGIEPEIGAVLPMERAEEAFRAMWEGRTAERRSSLDSWLGRNRSPRQTARRLRAYVAPTSTAIQCGSADHAAA